MKKKTSNYNPLAIPDEVYVEATINTAMKIATDYADKKFREMQVARARLNKTLRHYDHNVDVTTYPFYCSDCEIEITDRF